MWRRLLNVAAAVGVYAKRCRHDQHLKRIISTLKGTNNIDLRVDMNSSAKLRQLRKVENTDCVPSVRNATRRRVPSAILYFSEDLCTFDSTCWGVHVHTPLRNTQAIKESGKSGTCEHEKDANPRSHVRS